MLSAAHCAVVGVAKFVVVLGDRDTRDPGEQGEQAQLTLHAQLYQNISSFHLSKCIPLLLICCANVTSRGSSPASGSCTLTTAGRTTTTTWQSSDWRLLQHSQTRSLHYTCHILLHVTHVTCYTVVTCYMLNMLHVTFNMCYTRYMLHVHVTFYTCRTCYTVHRCGRCVCPPHHGPRLGAGHGDRMGHHSPGGAAV